MIGTRATTTGGPEFVPVPERIAAFDNDGTPWSEQAYNRQSPIGRLVPGLDEARRRGWLVVSMARDWARVFSFEAQ